MIFPNFLPFGVYGFSIGLGVALLLWLAVSLWAYRDMRRRSRSVGWALASFTIVLLLPIVGLLVYLLHRPPETLVAKYDRALSQEVMLQSIEGNLTCPGCSRSVQAEWMTCPECYVTLHRPCANCGTTLDLHWQICPVCSHVVEMPEPPRIDLVTTPS